MLGAYLCLWLIPHIHSFWLALLVAPLLVGILGALSETALLRPLYGRDISFQLLLTFGILLILDDAVKLIWGPGYHSLEPPKALAGTVHILHQGSLLAQGSPQEIRCNPHVREAYLGGSLDA